MSHHSETFPELKAGQVWMTRDQTYWYRVDRLELDVDYGGFRARGRLSIGVDFPNESDIAYYNSRIGRNQGFYSFHFDHNSHSSNDLVQLIYDPEIE